MTADEFRAMALSLPDTMESSHMDHPDFRVGGKIFASLGYPSSEWGMVALTADEQTRLCQAQPKVFSPANGAWGRGGATQVYLQLARKGSVRTALQVAWKNRVAKNAPAKKKAAKRARAKT